MTFTISYLPDQREVQAQAGDTILRTSLAAGIPHTHVCGGHARCSTCRVLILEGLDRCSERNSPEEAMARRLEFSPEVRLACQTEVNGAVKLRRLVLDAEDIELTSQLLPGQAPGAVGQERTIAIMFTDIRGFTSFAERLPPYDVIHILNRYFHKMAEAVRRNHGEVDNYMGDGLMALFDAGANPTLDAVRAGLDMLRALAEWRPYLEEVYGSTLAMRIGIHYGEAVVGAVGAANKRVTAIGDAVNFASRIEQANKKTGTSLLLSAAAYQQVSSEVDAGRSFRLAIPGKAGRHTLYEVSYPGEAAPVAR